MRKIDVKFQFTPGKSMPVGTLAEHERRVWFEYHENFLQSGLQLSPFKLPLKPGLMEHMDRHIGDIPGVFNDSLPDGWGLLLMDRHFRRQGIRLDTLSTLDRLVYLGKRTMGALTYHPPAAPEAPCEAIDLFQLGRNAEAIFEGDERNVLPQLIRMGGSPGGARPKALIGIKGNQIISGEEDLPDGYQHWIVKFSARNDTPYSGPIEYAYSQMAGEAGIDMPETRVFELGSGSARRGYFAVRRFDRQRGNRRLHMHTFANLVHIDFRIPTTDYEDLLKVTFALTQNHRDVLRLFRLMVFNIATNNRDDHAKNFSYLFDHEHNEWALAPAYDLTFCEGPGGEHSTTILGEGRHPTRQHCLELAKRIGIKPNHALEAIDAVNASVTKWKRFADQAGCPRLHRNRIAERLQKI